MSNYKVLWSEEGSRVRLARMFESADEARGFIRGLRVSEKSERIGLRMLGADGEYMRIKIADFFAATGEPVRRSPEPRSFSAAIPSERQDSTDEFPSLGGLSPVETTASA